MHYSKWSSIQWGTILKMSFREKYLKFRSNWANCAIWNMFQDFSVINVFWAVSMFENREMRKNFKSDKTISNRPATARFEIFLTQKLFGLSSCVHKMGIIYMHFLVKTISILFNNFKFHLKSCSKKSCCAIWNIGSRIPKLDYYSVMS